MHWDRSMQSFAPHFGSEHCRTHGDQLWRAKTKQNKRTKIDIKISVMWKQHTGFSLHTLLCSQLSTQKTDFISFFYFVFISLEIARPHTRHTIDPGLFSPLN